MNIVLYIIIFIMGSVFGSFLTLATYRIPLNEDITHKHSYCPKCNHKLNFLDLIPILSYVCLRGRCRYCKAKISPRYFIIELLCGIAFVLLALVLRINIYNLTIIKLLNFVFGMLYIIFLFLVGEIDKEHHYLDKRVFIYGLVVALGYWIYEIIYSTSFNVNRIIIYLIIAIVIIIVNTYQMKKKGKDSYTLSVILLCIFSVLFTNEVITIISIIMTLLIIAIYELILRIFKKDKKEKTINTQPIAFYLCIANFITLILANLILL